MPFRAVCPARSARQARLVRINPDFELADSSHASLVYSMVSIKEQALPALRKIDEQLRALQAEAEAAAAAAAGDGARAGRPG
eukprot:SAG22_NODE_1728_length_3710_cov_1.760731_2_plen_82_part_00